MNSILGIVMAKSASTRCPDKNIAHICGKPALAYTVDILRASGVCDKVIVSTDSTAYADLAWQHKVDDVVMRDTWWDNYPYFTVSVNESRKKYEQLSNQKFDNLVFVGANVIFLRPSWVRAGLNILHNYYYNEMPIDLITNDMDTVPIGICRVIRDGVVDPNTFKFCHSGVLCDFDWPDELDLARQLMEAIQKGDIDYPLEERIHDDKLRLIDASPNHFRGLTPIMCNPV